MAVDCRYLCSPLGARTNVPRPAISSFPPRWALEGREKPARCVRAEAGQWDGWDVRQIGLLVIAARLYDDETRQQGCLSFFSGGDTTIPTGARWEAEK